MEDLFENFGGCLVVGIVVFVLIACVAIVALVVFGGAIADWVSA